MSHMSSLKHNKMSHMLKMYLLGKQQLSAIELEAASIVNKNTSTPSISDLQKIKFTILGKDSISQS